MLQGLNEFCRMHPKLEQLCIEDSCSFSLDGNWKLNELKTLVYACTDFSNEGSRNFKTSLNYLS